MWPSSISRRAVIGKLLLVLTIFLYPRRSSLARALAINTRSNLLPPTCSTHLSVSIGLSEYVFLIIIFIYLVPQRRLEPSRSKLVRMVRLELTRFYSTASKTVAATSYATSANFFCLPPLRFAAIFALCSSLLGRPLLLDAFLFPSRPFAFIRFASSRPYFLTIRSQTESFF